jgi:hypothetical protein
LDEDDDPTSTAAGGVRRWGSPCRHALAPRSARSGLVEPGARAWPNLQRVSHVRSGTHVPGLKCYLYTRSEPFGRNSRCRRTTTSARSAGSGSRWRIGSASTPAWRRPARSASPAALGSCLPSSSPRRYRRADDAAPAPGVSEGCPTRRYSRPLCLATRKQPVSGNPNGARQHVLRRAGPPRDADALPPLHPVDQRVQQEDGEHAHAVALHFFTANYCRLHMMPTKARGGIHTSPAMAAGLTDHVWTIEGMLAMKDRKHTVT